MSELRQPLIENAVKFMQDAQVRQSGLERQVTFLQSKGLTKEEIEEAMRISGITETFPTGTETFTSTSGVGVPPLPNTPPPPAPPQYVQQQVSQESFDWGRLALILALVGSASVAITSTPLVKTFHRLYIALKRKLHLAEEPEPIELLRLEIERIEEGQTEIKNSIRDIQEKLGSSIDSVKMSQNYLYGELSNEMEELREQLQAITRPIKLSEDHNDKVDERPAIALSSQ